MSGTGAAYPSHRRPHARTQRRRLASRGDRLTFAGDAVFSRFGFEHPDWFNGFEHDPEEAPRVRVSLLRELRRTASRWWPLTCRSLP